jgi:hypothetical protein
MLANNLIKNLSSESTINSSDLTNKLTNEAKFFEDAVVREQIYKLYSNRIIVEAEQ